VAKRLRGWLSLAIGAATIFWLGYSTGRVQSISDLAMRSRDADTDRYSISRGGLLLHFERLGGDGKPYLRSGTGQELLDLSDWDRDSRIVVDGSLYELVRLYPQSSVDYERYRLAETLNGDGWFLEREVSLAPNGVIQIQHSFVARRPIRRVDLALAHTHQYFLSLQVDETSVTATVNGLTRDQTDGGVEGVATHRLTIRGGSEAPSPRFRSGAAQAYGPSAFIADMSADAPAVDQRVVLGQETISVEVLPS